jgi:hypothetical protein
MGGDGGVMKGESSLGDKGWLVLVIGCGDVAKGESSWPVAVGVREPECFDVREIEPLGVRLEVGDCISIWH